MVVRVVGPAIGCLLLASVLVCASAHRGVAAGLTFVPLGQGCVTPTNGSACVQLQTRFAQTINVRDYGATGNAVTLGDGTVTASSCAFSSASAVFTAADVGKKIIVNGAGTSGGVLSTTIASFVDANDITLTACAATTTPWYRATAAIPITSGVTASYAPGDVLTMTGGTSTTASALTVAVTTLVSATVNATRLVAGASVNSSAANGVDTLNLANNSAWLIDLDCVYRDVPNPAVATWYWKGILLTRGANAASTAAAVPTPTTGQTSGSPGASAPTVAADTTNGGLSVTFTAPNADISYVTCRAHVVVS